MASDNSQPKSSQKIRIITNLLTSALKLWLKSQVSQIEELAVEIKASDRQLLSGCVPWVSIFATHAVYQGLHLTQVELLAENIRINIGSVLKGQPLRLLETVPVVGNLTLDEEDLNFSLSSELFSAALNDLLVQLLPEPREKSKPSSWQKIILDHNQAILYTTATPETEPTSIEICMGLELVNSHELRLAPIEMKRSTGALLESIHELDVDLGSDVDIQELSLIPGKLICSGRINVNP